MVIIIDGLDCSGKSTVYDRLRSELDGAYFLKDSYPAPSDIERMDRLALFKRRSAEPYLYVYDRATVIDDPVYEYLFNERTSILEEEMDSETFKNCLVLHFTVDKDVWLKRMEDRGDAYVDIDDYEAIIESYDAFYRKYQPKMLEVIDTTNLSKDEAFRQAYYIINNFKEDYENGF